MNKQTGFHQAMRTATQAAKATRVSVRVRRVRTSTGLLVHVLDGAPKGETRGVLLLLHGFPELSYSWRRVIPLLTEAGYRVIAPDQRGYGGTTGWSQGYDVDLAEFGMPALVADAAALLSALEVDAVDAVIGHDFGSPVAAWCAMMRPDIFQSVVCMSAPFSGAPAAPNADAPDIHEALAALDPPRRHYQWYYGERRANEEMTAAPEGLTKFLRAYFHCKSGDWEGNRPYRLEGWTAEALAQLPRYYVMDLNASMPETVASMAPPPKARCDWLSEKDLSVYVRDYRKTGFQGGLNWYRRMTSPEGGEALAPYRGQKIQVPACFVGGAEDWGVYQVPGALEAMETEACADYRGTHLIDGAGHWVQQEQSEAVVERVMAFLA